MAQINKTRKVVVQAEIESTYGTAPTFTAAEDPLLLYAELNPLQVQGDIFNPVPVKPSLSPTKGVVGAARYALTLQTVLQGTEDLTTDKRWRFGKVLRACGLQETNTTTVNFVYTPRSSGFESLAAEVYYENEAGGNSLKHVVEGMYGTFQMSASQPGAEVQVTANMQGLYNAPTVAAVISPTFATAKPVAWQNASGTFNNGSARTPVIKSWSLTGGVSVTERRDGNAADGLIGYQIESRTPEFQWVIELDTDIGVLMTDWKNSTTHNIAMNFIAGGAESNVAFAAPAAWINQAPQAVDVNGVRCYQINYSLTGTDNEYTLTFT